jgi:hypothetical protein
MSAGMMNLKLDMDHPADRELRRAVLDLFAGRKMRKQKALPSVIDCCFHHRMNLPGTVARKRRGAFKEPYFFIRPTLRLPIMCDRLSLAFRLKNRGCLVGEDSPYP